MVKDLCHLQSGAEKYSFGLTDSSLIEFGTKRCHGPTLTAKTEPLVAAPFIPSHDPPTCCQLACWFWNLPEQCSWNILQTFLSCSASVPTSVSVLEASNSTCLYLENAIKLVSGNTENLFFLPLYKENNHQFKKLNMK